MILLLIFISLSLGLSFRWYIAFVLVITISLFLFLFFRFKKRILVVSLISFAIGIGISYIQFDFNKETYSGVVIESKDNYFLLSSSFEKLYVYQKDNQYEVGDILNVDGKKKEISFTRIESSFDFKTYLNKKGVRYEVVANNITTKFSNPIRLKEIKEKSLSSLDKDSQSIIRAIVFSDLDEENEFISDLKSLHLMRLLSTSGLYVYFFYSVLLWLFNLFFKEKISKIISTSFILIYALLLFPKFSIIRFATFLIFKLINEYILKHKISYLSLLSLSGIFFMLIDYHLTYQISFMLGYSIPLLTYFVSKCLKGYKKIIKKTITLSFIFIFLIPVDIYFYNEFSLFSYIFQLLLTPLFMVIAFVAILLLIKVPVNPIMIHLINGLKNISNVFNYINITIYAHPLNQFAYAIYIILIVILIFLFQIKLKPLLIYLNLSYFIVMSLYLLPINNLVTSEVSFINVGQGDSCLIRKGNTAIMIDTGGSINKDIAKECLIPYLKKKQIYDIDLLITTHDDYDHSGAKDSLCKYFKVKNYINNASVFPLNINGINLYNYNNYQDEVTDENDKSLVIGFNLHNTSYLITGDAPKEIEYKIMENYEFIDCDILKVGHHGSNTSTSDEFVKYLTPKEAIISCGKNNKYHHPHKETIDVLKKNKVKIRRTDEEGSITYRYLF